MRHLKIAVLLVAGLVATQAAWGQGYPNKPVRIIVPFAAGSADLGGRAMIWILFWCSKMIGMEIVNISQSIFQRGESVDRSVPK